MSDVTVEPKIPLNLLNLLKKKPLVGSPNFMLERTSISFVRKRAATLADVERLRILSGWDNDQ